MTRQKLDNRRTEMLTEEEQLIEDCGFDQGIDFASVPEDLRDKILAVMQEWREADGMIDA